MLTQEKSDISQAIVTVEAQPVEQSPRRPWLKLAIAAVLLGGGIASLAATSTKDQMSQSAAAQLPPRPVETVSLESGTGVQKLELIGEVEAADQATVRSRAAGVVTRVLVNVGDSVRPGQPLAILDQGDQDLALAEARAALASARSELQRLETGTRPEIIAQRQAELRAAQAREQEAKDNLRNMEALMPDLMAQRQAELEMAQATETEAQDDLERTRNLTTQGALARRALIEAESRAKAATSDRLRAAAALTSQQTENQQRLAEARASLDAAIGERLRVTSSLAESTAGPRREEIEAQRGQVKAAETAVAQAQLELERATITADIAGVIGDRFVNTGDYIERNAQVVSLVSGDRLDIYLDVPESLSGQVNTGTPVTLAASALPDWQGRATVTGVVPTADAASRRQRVRVRLNNVPDGLVPGMAMTGILERPTPEAQFVLSRDALTRRLDGWVVYVIDDQNQAQEVSVQLIADMGQTVAVASSELTLGAMIVKNGGDGLTDGSPVQIIESRRSEDSQA